jgi:transposase
LDLVRRPRLRSVSSWDLQRVKLSAAVDQLRQSGLQQMVQLGNSLSAWSEEIVVMWRFTRNNRITEGFHNNMELINRQAYGFRNFQKLQAASQGICS